MNWKLWLLAFSTTLALSACKEKKSTEKTKSQAGQRGGAGGPGGGRNQVLKVEGYVVRTSTTHESLEVPGSLLPNEETEIHPEVSGKITAIRFAEGSMVGRGALLAKIFDGDLQAQKRKLQIQLQTAQKTQQRQAELLKIHAVSQQEYDLAMLQSATYRADIQIINADIARTEIRAPFSGKLGFRNVSVGAYVTPASVITTISQVNQLKLTFSVPERYSSKVAIGNYVTFTVEGAPGRYSAKIIATETGVTEETRSLQVKALVQAIDRNVAAGRFARVRFDLGEDNQSIMVPSQAVLPQARGKKIIVYRRGAVEFQDVTTGIRDSANVQITSGLAVGDTILTTGLLSIKPNSKVQLVRVK
jgi:membrane fusion protein, multidrug efflux system